MSSHVNIRIRFPCYKCIRYWYVSSLKIFMELNNINVH